MTKTNFERIELRSFLIKESRNLEHVLDAEMTNISMEGDEDSNDTALIVLVRNQAPHNVEIVRFTGIQFHSAYGHVVQSRKRIQTVGGITQ